MECDDQGMSPKVLPPVALAMERAARLRIALRKQQLPTVARARPEPVRLEQMLVRPQPARLIALQRSKKISPRHFAVRLARGFRAPR